MSYHSMKEAREVLAETGRILAADKAKKTTPTVTAQASAAGKAKPVAAKPVTAKPTWPQAVATLARANNWTKAKAASELEKMPGGAELRQEYVAAQNAIARKEREIVILRGRQSAARAAVAAR
jgi:hypothetical protein